MELLEVYGLLAVAEIKVIHSYSKTPEIELALRETIKHLQEAQVSLKTALTFRSKEEKEE